MFSIPINPRRKAVAGSDFASLSIPVLAGVLLNCNIPENRMGIVHPTAIFASLSIAMSVRLKSDFALFSGHPQGMPLQSQGRSFHIFYPDKSGLRFAQRFCAVKRKAVGRMPTLRKRRLEAVATGLGNTRLRLGLLFLMRLELVGLILLGQALLFCSCF